LIIAADALALEVDAGYAEENVEIGEALEALDIAPSASEGLVDEVRRERENLSTFFRA
jgi:hypothetical protein